MTVDMADSTNMTGENDVEAVHRDSFINDAVSVFAWRGLTVTIKDKATKEPKAILQDATGLAKAGEIVALMGPSGSGKTTLLNVLAHRTAAASAHVEGDITIDGSKPSLHDIRRISSYVEQEDALIGSLTVRETLDFAARLALPHTMSTKERKDRVNELLVSFGLSNQSATLIGTPIRKGISGGQKRRVSVASQLITAPKIVFLDEPTSGLDSTASYEVMSFVKDVARRYKLIVIASIHQPSTATFELFDKLLLLSRGRTCYYGPVRNVKPYFDNLGFPMPAQINPAEYILDLTNVDFSSHNEDGQKKLENIQSGWSMSADSGELDNEYQSLISKEGLQLKLNIPPRTNQLYIPLVLLHRSFIKSYRDVVVYGIRIMMYTALAIMMGTVWLRLHTDQTAIQPYINAIFFGSAFMSFMAIAYVPAFLEDRATFVKERANGLYGTTSFLVSNFIIGLPYLFLISILFSLIAYWLSNFRPTADAFFMWVMWLFLDLVAAESLVVLMSSIFPNFVIALALIAFANGLWMSVGGFLVTPKILNVFWKYVFHYIDYQAYVFQGMMVNEFKDRSYSCGDGCNCMYPSELESQCRIAGTAVLDQYNYSTHRTGEWVGILIAIIVGYRLLAWLVTHFKRT